ncbi:hypothetical protein D3C80_1242690 [compost metagenome]
MRIADRFGQQLLALLIRLEIQPFADIQRAQLAHDGQVAILHGLFADHPRQ